MFADQSNFDVRCEWGQHGVQVLAAISEVVVVVDVLSFCTTVDVAVGRGVKVFPYRYRDQSAEAYARTVGAVLASSARSEAGGYSLSPVSFLEAPSGARVVLPSPNGAMLSMAAQASGAVVLAGCLRNASAVAARIGQRSVSVIAAGERWEDGSLRPAVEDWIGAGAVISALVGGELGARQLSPEATLAVAAFSAARTSEGGLKGFLRACSSGRELLERGFAQDVDLAADLDISRCSPELKDGVFQT